MISITIFLFAVGLTFFLLGLMGAILLLGVIYAFAYYEEKMDKIAERKE